MDAKQTIRRAADQVEKIVWQVQSARNPSDISAAIHMLEAKARDLREFNHEWLKCLVDASKEVA